MVLTGLSQYRRRTHSASGEIRNTKMPMFKQRRVNPFRVSRKFFGSNFEKILNSMNYDDFKNAITSLGALTVNNFIFFSVVVYISE